MQPLLVCRYRHFFLIYSVLDVDCSLILLAIVRSCIDSLLHGEEITASVLGDNKVIIYNM